MAKITFKREKHQTGLAAVGHPYPDVEIKHKGKVVGMIYAPAWNTENNWRVSLMVKDKDFFTWKTIKKRFPTEEETRQWIKENNDKLLAFNLYHMDDD